MLFAKEQLAKRELTASILSRLDLMDTLRHKLPFVFRTDDDLVAMIEDRYRLRSNGFNPTTENRPKPLAHKIWSQSE